MAEFKRSRLSRKDDEIITKKTIFLGVVTMILFVLVVVFGLPLLVRFSLFLGNMKKEKDIVKEKKLPPLPPRIEIAYDATNSATIDITGFSEPKIEVELLKNDVSLGKKNVSDTGEFNYKNVVLDKGENIFNALAISEEYGSSELSLNTKIVFDDEVPTLTMTNPSEEKITVDIAEYDIIGVTEKGASVTVNGRVAIVDDNGQFKLKIQLDANKENDVEIKARDLAGNEISKKIKIKYEI